MSTPFESAPKNEEFVADQFDLFAGADEANDLAPVPTARVVIPILREDQLAAPVAAAVPSPAASLQDAAPKALFPFPAGAEELPHAVEAHQAIYRLMEAGHPCVVAFSSGKDSSVVANLTLTTAAVRVARGEPVPPILVIHSDTGVENPEVRALADGEIAKIRRFARDYGVPVEVRVGKPLLYTTWPVRVISGRALPSFANSSRDCSVEWKVKVGRRLMAEAFKDLTGVDSENMTASERKVAKALQAAAPQPVVMTGVRKGESSARNAAISERGEKSDHIWEDEQGRSFMSPILSWGADDVFEYLGYASADLIPSYSKFEETMQFYRDAGGSSCAVVGDLKMAEQVAKTKGGCGARSGCWTCVRVQKDASLEQMIESDEERYGYMARLNQLRDFIARTQYDWSRRNFMGRSIDKDGFIAIQADAYSPDMLEELLHYTLSVQVAENTLASRRGVEPRFQIIGPRELVAIDSLWSLYGLHRPFHAFEILRRVENGNLRFAPSAAEVPGSSKTPVPRLGNLYVGADWESELLTGDPVRDRMISGGIRDDVSAMFAESCGKPLVANLRGELISAWDTAESFDVDESAAADFIGTGMAYEMLDRYHDNPRSAATTAVKKYLGLGMVMPVVGGLASWHRIAKRTDWLERHGLTGQIPVERLQEMLEEQEKEAEQALSTERMRG